MRYFIYDQEVSQDVFLAERRQVLRLVGTAYVWVHGDEARLLRSQDVLLCQYRDGKPPKVEHKGTRLPEGEVEQTRRL